MTAEALAGELEVSVRTIYRDIEALSMAGVPVFAERGPGGGCQLVEGYRTRLTGLSGDEAEALFLSGLEGPAAQLGLGSVLAAAQIKVTAALPPELRGRASRLRERFHLEAPGWFRQIEPVPFLAVAAEALWSDRRLQITYRPGERATQRTLDPLGLVLKAGTWYLVARREGAIRTYRVARIGAATALDEHFERPQDFDLARYWTDSTLAFERELDRITVRLRIEPQAIDDLAYAVASGRRVGEPQGEPSPVDGRVLVTMRHESLEAAHDDLLRLGDRAEVIDPPELRSMLAATAQAMAGRYAAAGPDDAGSPRARATASALESRRPAS
jgi:predicted DNA-binding transcriptional regulator YafY